MLTKNPQFRVYRKRSLEEKNIKKLFDTEHKFKRVKLDKTSTTTFLGIAKKPSLLFRDLETSKKKIPYKL